MYRYYYINYEFINSMTIKNTRNTITVIEDNVRSEDSVAKLREAFTVKRTHLFADKIHTLTIELHKQIYLLLSTFVSEKEK